MLDMTTFAAAMKELYKAQTIENMVYKNNPFLAMVAKMESFTGKNYPQPIIYGNPQNRSATFSVAVAGNTNSQLKEFFLTRVSDYSVAEIDNQTLEASQDNAGAFLEAATVEVDGAIQSATRSLAIALFGSGSGELGNVQNSSFATTVLQLTDANDVTNFEVGMVLVASATNGTGSVKSGSLSIVGVDRDNGQLTMSQNLSTGIATIAQDDYLFAQGDYGLKVKGLRAWLPDTAPTAGDNFFGVDRSSDVTRLAGIRYDASSMPIEEGLISAASRLAREGGNPDVCFMDYSKYADLEKALGSKVQYIDLKVTAEIGFRGIMINGPRGPIKVVPDQNCPSDRAFMLQLDTWKLYSLGKAPSIFSTDGLNMLRNQTTDSLQIRCKYYAQLGTRAPGYNANIRLS